MPSSRLSVCLPILLSLACAACGKKAEKPAPPTPTVGVVTTATATVPIDIELPGRTAPFLTSDVRPQVSGILQQRLFTEGSFVRRGQPLYRIDPRVYQAAVGQAQGNLQGAQANAVTARLRAGRYGDLEKMNAVARQDADDARASAGQAEATIAQNQAALQSARINLLFTTVRAPISGRIGRSLVTAGALVTASQTEALSTIQTLDPIFVDIQQSASQLLALRRALMKGGALPASAPVVLRLEDGSVYPARGQLLFSDVTVDPTTGAVTLRARFPNPDNLLLPGLFVRAVVQQASRPGVVLIPAQGVQHDPRGAASVYVVGAGGKAAQRPVQTQGMQGNNWIVTGGLRPGEKVVIEGTGNVQPGKPVRAVAATGKPSESAAMAPAGGAPQGGGASPAK